MILEPRFRVGHAERPSRYANLTGLNAAASLKPIKLIAHGEQHPMRYLFILLVAVSVGVNAAPMSPVSANNKLWLQPLDFQGVTWNQASAVCDELTGQCSGFLNGIDITGWNWAGIAEVNQLFNYYMAQFPFPVPQLDPWSGVGISGSTLGVLSLSALVFDDFETIESFGYAGVHGWTRNREGDLGYIGSVNFGQVVIEEDLAVLEFSTGSVSPIAGPANPAQFFSGFDFVPAPPNVGGGIWLYRAEADVPGPSTVSLIGLALGCLGWMRRSATLKATLPY